MRESFENILLAVGIYRRIAAFFAYIKDIADVTVSQKFRRKMCYRVVGIAYESEASPAFLYVVIGLPYYSRRPEAETKESFSHIGAIKPYIFVAEYGERAPM